MDSLLRATSVLKKNLGFMQTGKAAKALASMANGLQKIVEASWVNAHQKSVIQSLLQSQSEASDEDFSLQPQATAAAYASQSSGTPGLFVHCHSRNRRCSEVPRIGFKLWALSLRPALAETARYP